MTWNHVFSRILSLYINLPNNLIIAHVPIQFCNSFLNILYHSNKSVFCLFLIAYSVHFIWKKCEKIGMRGPQYLCMSWILSQVVVPHSKPLKSTEWPWAGGNQGKSSKYLSRKSANVILKFYPRIKGCRKKSFIFKGLIWFTDEHHIKVRRDGVWALYGFEWERERVLECWKD